MTCCYIDHSETFECTQPERTTFTEADREKLDAVCKAVMEVQELIKQVEPFLDSFMGGSGAPANPMNMIFKSLMGGR